MADLRYSLLDHHFASFLAHRSGLVGERKERFEQLLQDLSASLGAGHSCLEVKREEERLLEQSPLVARSTRSVPSAPLVLFAGRLYLHRYFCYEVGLAWRIKEMGDQCHPVQGGDVLLETWFPTLDDGVDHQRLGAGTSLERSFSIISGGPGTGKTSTVIKIIILLLTVLGPEMKIALAAPTGKAAMRLRQSMNENREKLSVASEIKQAIPTEALTLHRLLGVKRFSPSFRHHRHNPLAYDVVIVDEASMVDLALMAKLVDGLKPGSRLILLGDKDQLASVESGSVLTDLMAGLPDNTTVLSKTYRFNRTIKKLADHINGGRARSAWSLLVTEEQTEAVVIPLAASVAIMGSQYEAYMAAATGFREGDKLGPLFERFLAFRVLCGVRRGEAGVEAVNRGVERYLTARGYDCSSEPFYPGRPVMVTQNDYTLQLYNGDIGLCLSGRDGRVKVWFERSDGTITGYLPHRLGRCETVFAMSIHKSQGSEFNEVMVLLPRQDNRVLTRELLYTAVTRARKKVTIVADQEIFALAVSRQVRRASGLKTMLLDEKFVTRNDLYEKERAEHGHP